MSEVVEEDPGPPRTDRFADQSKRYSFLVSCEVARMVTVDPDLIEVGRRHLERFSKSDPSQRHGYELWDELLRQPVDDIAARLTELSQRGDYARETKPCFAVLPILTRLRLIEEARRPLNYASVASDVGGCGQAITDP